MLTAVLLGAADGVNLLLLRAPLGRERLVDLRLPARGHLLRSLVMLRGSSVLGRERSVSDLGKVLELRGSLLLSSGLGRNDRVLLDSEGPASIMDIA